MKARRKIAPRRASRQSPLTLTQRLERLERHYFAQKATSPVASVRFTVTDNTVLDNTTGLMWTRNSVGGKRMSWNDAKKFCASLDHGGHQDWRLPTIKELLSIVDYSRISPSIDTEAFQCESNWYWTSTPYAGPPAVCAWFVGFSSGSSLWILQSGEYYVRAVRAGQIIGSLV